MVDLLNCCFIFLNGILEWQITACLSYNNGLVIFQVTPSFPITVDCWHRSLSTLGNGVFWLLAYCPLWLRSRFCPPANTPTQDIRVDGKQSDSKRTLRSTAQPLWFYGRAMSRYVPQTDIIKGLLFWLRHNFPVTGLLPQKCCLLLCWLLK